MKPAWPNAIVFDFDGLILDTESSAFHSTAEIYRDHGVELGLDFAAADLVVSSAFELDGPTLAGLLVR